MVIGLSVSQKHMTTFTECRIISVAEIMQHRSIPLHDMSSFFKEIYMDSVREIIVAYALWI